MTGGSPTIYKARHDDDDDDERGDGVYARWLSILMKRRHEKNGMVDNLYSLDQSRQHK